MFISWNEMAKICYFSYGVADGGNDSLYFNHSISSCKSSTLSTEFTLQHLLNKNWIIKQFNLNTLDQSYLSTKPMNIFVNGEDSTDLNARHKIIASSNKPYLISKPTSSSTD